MDPHHHILSDALYNNYFWFLHSYDVILLANPQDILKKFLEFNANLVFSAEGFCWPDRLLKVSTILILSQLVWKSELFLFSLFFPFPLPCPMSPPPPLLPSSLLHSPSISCSPSPLLHSSPLSSSPLSCSMFPSPLLSSPVPLCSHLLSSYPFFSPALPSPLLFSLLLCHSPLPSPLFSPFLPCDSSSYDLPLIFFSNHKDGCQVRNENSAFSVIFFTKKDGITSRQNKCPYFIVWDCIVGSG